MGMEQKKKKGGFIGRALMVSAGGLLILDTLFVLTRSSPNLGVIMPAIIGAPLFLIGVFLPLFKKLCKRSRIIRAAAFMLSLAYLLSALTFAVTTSLILINSSEPDGGADALIILGGGIRGNSPTLTLRYRLDRAIEYLEDHPDTCAVVSGGQGQDEVVSEAAVMRAYLEAHGVAGDRILVEDRSESTSENFIFSKALIDDRLGKDAAISFVTTRFHVFRAERVAAKLGVDAQGVPARGVWYITFNDYLRECAAVIVYFLRGDI